MCESLIRKSGWGSSPTVEEHRAAKGRFEQSTWLVKTEDMSVFDVCRVVEITPHFLCFIPSPPENALWCAIDPLSGSPTELYDRPSPPVFFSPAFSRVFKCT